MGTVISDLSLNTVVNILAEYYCFQAPFCIVSNSSRAVETAKTLLTSKPLTFSYVKAEDKNVINILIESGSIIIIWFCSSFYLNEPKQRNVFILTGSFAYHYPIYTCDELCFEPWQKFYCNQMFGAGATELMVWLYLFLKMKKILNLIAWYLREKHTS